MARPSDWRDQNAARLAAEAIRRLRPSGFHALVVEDRLTLPDRELEGEGARVDRWNRRAFGGRPAGLRPPTGPFDLALLRLPRSKAELELTAHQVASVLRPGARLLLYGAKDEGIGSAPGRIEGLFDSCEPMEVGGHCRVWSLKRPTEPTVPLRPDPADWAQTFDPGFGLSPEWVSYPGVFAHGELDRGTRLLAECLTPPRPGTAVLDFGAGTGVLGALNEKLGRDVSVDLLDIDAFALEAAKANVPGAGLVLGDGLAAVGERRYDRIVTNPPIHLGKAESMDAVHRLLDNAYTVLSRKGSVWLVIQKRFPLEAVLAERFRQVTVRAEDEVFRVWEGRRPLYGGGRR